MPTIYLRKDLYDKIASLKEDINDFVNKCVDEKLNTTVEDTIFPRKGKKE